MIFSIADILRETGQKFNIDESFEHSVEGMNCEGPVALELTVVNAGSQVNVRGKIAGDFKTECSRCLKELVIHLETEVDEGFLSELERKPDLDSAEDFYDEVLTYHNDQLDLSELIRQEFLAAMPYAPSCPEKCQSYQELGGQEVLEKATYKKPEVDPRWAPLQKLVDQSKN